MDETKRLRLAGDPREAVNGVSEREFTAGFWRQQIFRWLREQEHLRAGAPAPEEALIPEDLGRYLGGVGYLQYVEPEPNDDGPQNQIDD